MGEKTRCCSSALLVGVSLPASLSARPRVRSRLASLTLMVENGGGFFKFCDI